MWRHYVYLHRRPDSGVVFYVGKGSFRKRCKRGVSFERAHAPHKNPFWQNIVSCVGGFDVEIVAMFATDADAQAHERALIALYGRRDRGTGTLVNVTDGGDGHAGIIVSNELRQKRRRNASQPRSEAWCAAIRKARHKGGNGGVVKKGDRLSESWRQAIAEGQRGPNNYMRGKRGALHPNARPVVNIETGERWPTVDAAATALGLKMKSLYNQLSGHRKNPTPLRFAT
jgi:hypothetical protein